MCISRQTDEHEPIHHECIGTLCDRTHWHMYTYATCSLTSRCVCRSPWLFPCLFCCDLVQREVLLWNFKDYLKFQRKITEKFQNSRQVFCPWLVDALCHLNADKTSLRCRGSCGYILERVSVALLLTQSFSSLCTNKVGFPSFLVIKQTRATWNCWM